MGAGFLRTTSCLNARIRAEVFFLSGQGIASGHGSAQDMLSQLAAEQECGWGRSNCKQETQQGCAPEVD